MHRRLFCKEMLACRNTLPRAKVLEEVRAGLRAGRYTQVAQLETEATKRQMPAAAAALVGV